MKYVRMTTSTIALCFCALLVGWATSLMFNAWIGLTVGAGFFGYEIGTLKDQWKREQEQEREYMEGR